MAPCFECLNNRLCHAFGNAENQRRDGAIEADGGKEGERRCKGAMLSQQEREREREKEAVCV